MFLLQCCYELNIITVSQEYVHGLHLPRNWQVYQSLLEIIPLSVVKGSRPARRLMGGNPVIPTPTSTSLVKGMM